MGADMGLIIALILVILLIGGLPTWGYSSGLGYGYYPSGILGIVLIVVIVLVLLGRL